ncbi:MAG: hypothetical protein AAF682_04955 [Planctomycetota bacterium]
MSPIGRIFLVLNLILSAAFLGWASNSLAQTEDFKMQLEDKSTAMAEMEQAKDDEISKLEVDLAASEAAERERREQRDQLEAQVNQLQTQLEGEQREKDGLLGDVTGIKSTLGDYEQSFTRISGEKDQAVERAHEAEQARDDALTAQQDAEQAQRDAEDAQATLERQVADLEIERTTLQDQVSMLDTRLQVLVEVTGTSYEDILAQDKVDGAVLAVDANLGLVMLNVGGDAGVKKGYSFDVWSGNQYKGQVRVVNVQAGMCSAVIEDPVDGAPIQQGDSASTRML